ncbi:MAG: septation protein IspZ [Rhodobacteraceae bacterium]|nr:MAG: septation protein IspZ [Paracoccaceae bacterium]
MTTGPLHPTLKAVLEFGPLTAFLIVYLIFRDDTFVVGGTEYSGFLAVTAAFIPVFLMATGALWYLTGRLTRLQIVIAGMLIVFGGMSVWLNDPSLFKMKPTAIYSLLALILGVGLMRGQSWLEFVLEDALPLTHRGWMILTRRVTLLFVLAAVANEVVWRTQSEEFWVIFETIAMPIIVFVFFVAQVGLFVDHGTLKPSWKPAKSPGRTPGQVKGGQCKGGQGRKRRARRAPGGF